MAHRAGIETMLYLLDEAFRGAGIEDGSESQALLLNLRSVPDSAWHHLPDGATRSIEAIAIHMGACKVLDSDYAFGGAATPFGRPEADRRRTGEPEMAEVLPWLDRVHEAFVAEIAALEDDGELDRPRRTNRGEDRATRWLIGRTAVTIARPAG